MKHILEIWKALFVRWLYLLVIGGWKGETAYDEFTSAPDGRLTKRTTIGTCTGSYARFDLEVKKVFYGKNPQDYKTEFYTATDIMA